ncbi:unnamed protein product [Clonostachys rosea]|uniref:Cytochrome P450 n=1 Tax=Bionectria ochroleuca TaxID=29856 RepID=A0ABY6U141_BIOOC|nr:unnamed protein product [Clonostachys rosea]
MATSISYSVVGYLPSSSPLLVFPDLSRASLILFIVILFTALRHILSSKFHPVRLAPSEWKAYHWPILGSALRFYSTRRDMIMEGTSVSHSGDFGFYIGKKHVISVSSLAGRRTIYENRSLNFPAGFVELLAGIPSIGEPAKEQSWHRQFNKIMCQLTRKEVLVRRLPVWFQDIQASYQEFAMQPPMTGFKSWRVMNPFDSLYLLVYKLTIRVVGSTDIADDPEILRRTLGIFDTFEKSSSVMGFVFPWLITGSHITRLVYGIRLYYLLAGNITKRQTGQTREDDALQYLLDQGSPFEEVIKFQMCALWAGVLTTGTVGSWAPVFLASHPRWLAKCQEEIQAVVAKHRASSTQGINDVLGTLQFTNWECDFPVMQACLQETLRMVIPGTVFRKNTSGAAIPIGSTGQVVPNGSFLAFLIDHVHMDPSFYPDPSKFDPGRYLDDASPHTTEPHTFVGFGSGCHPCTGMKVAKLELTMMVVLFISSFQFELSDRHGAPTSKNPPLPDRNNHKAKRDDKPCYLRIRLRDQMGCM